MRLWQRLFGKRTVRCKECLFCEEQWLSGLHDQGLYRFWYCSYLIHDLKMVEPELERECEDFKEEEEEVEVKRLPNPKVSIFTPRKRG